MSELQNPLVHRRRLRMELRNARLAAGLPRTDVAAALDWSASKVVRIENGTVGVSTTDLRALLELYGITDRHRVSELIKIAQSAKRQTWNAYKDIYPPAFLTYLSFESAAAVIRQFESLLIPGLLQTEEYAEIIIRLFDREGTPEDVIERKVRARMERQSLLFREKPPRMVFILDEAIIRRWVGGSEVMRHQLKRLIELNTLPHVAIQIIPLKSGEHVGMMGPFVLLEFSESHDDDLLFRENARGDVVTRDDPNEAATYMASFWDLEARSSSKEQLIGLIDEILLEMADDCEREAA